MLKKITVICSNSRVGNLTPKKWNWEPKTLWQLGLQNFNLFCLPTPNSGVRGPPQFLIKTFRECRGKWKSFMEAPIFSRNRSGSCSENCGFRIAQVVRRHSENGIFHSENDFLNSESSSENTPELSQSFENGLFTPREFLLKLGWFPGFWQTKRRKLNQETIFVVTSCFWEALDGHLHTRNTVNEWFANYRH